jgi:hypothetical protein
MNVFIGVLLQLYTWNNVLNTSPIQLPSEFSSTDDLTRNFLLLGKSKVELSL